MKQYLVGQGYWSYIIGAHEEKPETTHANYPTWEQGASRVLYCLATCVHDHMLSHVRDAKTPKEAWENLRKIFAADTSARRLQLRQELNNIRQQEMSVMDYTAKIKSICDSLASINVNIDEEEMVQVCLGGLAQRFNPLRTAILARDTPPSFFNLQSMLLVEENHVQTKPDTSEGQMFFSDSASGQRRGRSGRGRFDLSHEGSSQFRQGHGSHRGTFTRRGSFHAEQGRRTTPPMCNYCGKIGHREEECRKRRSESASTSRQLTNYATNAEYADYGGLFVMRHRANSMMASDSASTANSEHTWFVDSGASHHMTSHQEWFRDLRTPDRPGYIETGDDTPHPIRHIGDVPFGKDGEKTCIKDVLHVPTITKNLVSVGQLVEQGMQVRFNNDGCLIEKDGRVIAKGRRDGRLFILDSNDVKPAEYEGSRAKPRRHKAAKPCAYREEVARTSRAPSREEKAADRAARRKTRIEPRTEPIEEELNANSDDDTRPSPPPKGNPSSTELIDPQEPPRDENTSRPSPTSDKGKGKMPEYEVEELPDRDSDDSARSLDSEFGVPIMRTPGVKKALTSTNEKLRRSSRAKTHVTRFAYNEYMAHHYALAMMVVDPSLRHRLEGENKPRREAAKKAATRSRAQRSRDDEPRTTKPRRGAAQRSRDEEPRRKPRNAAKKPQAAPMPTKPKEAKPDVGRLTLELEGAC